MTKKTDNASVDSVTVRARIEHQFPQPYTPAANHMTVQRDGDMFRISFFHIQTPLLIGNDEENQAAVDSIESLPAYCVADAMVGAEKMKGIIEALSDNYDRFLASKTDDASLSHKKGA